MPDDIVPLAEQSASSLVNGILGDLQHLVDQQFHLLRREIEVGLRQRATTVLVLGIGACGLLLSGMMGCLSLSHLLHWSTSPAGTDPSRFPLWACDAVVAAAVAVGGGILLSIGRARLIQTTSMQNPRSE